MNVKQGKVNLPLFNLKKTFFFVFFKITMNHQQLTVSMKRSRRELSIDMVIRVSLKKAKLRSSPD